MNDLGKWLQGVGNVVNPFDGGKGYSDAWKPQQEQPVKQAPQPDLLTKVNNFTGAVNDKTYGSVMRAGTMAARGVMNIPVRAMEALNPNDDESRGDQLLNKSAQRYGFTPQFKQQIYKANPIVRTGRLDVGNALVSGEAAGYRKQGELHRIVINDNGVSDQGEVLFHEGLHDVYDTLQPKQREQFYGVANRALASLPDKPLTLKSGRIVGNSTGLSKDLMYYLKNYTGAPKELTDVRSLPENLQNEVHSYIPRYFSTSKREMPSDLASYYANYYNTGSKASTLQQRSSVEQVLGRIFK